MNKIFKGLICAGLGCILLAAPGCSKSGTYDTETRTLKLATGALDGNFNPFFYTSQNDGNMIGLTQISMLTNDSDGNIVAGEDWPTAVLDYSVTSYNTKQVGTGSVIKDGSTEGRTEYEFVIKNGVKFSDGKYLTIADVLFNLYVYLDPAYTGSATIYSTDIQGLKAYRAQDSSLTDDSDADTESGFTAAAQARILELIEYSTDNSPLSAQGEKDLETVKELFKEEADSDWTSIYASFPDSYKDSYRFTSVWQAYLYEEGLVTVLTKKNANGTSTQVYEDINGNGKKDDGELYYTTLDIDPNDADATEPEAWHFFDMIAKATTDEEVQAYMTANNCDEEYATLMLQKEACVDAVVQNYTTRTQIANVLTYWGTASTALEKFTGEARSEYFDENRGEVKSISGITTYKTSEFNNKSLGEEHDVLKIVINGVDPKAIYNFSFVVAPLHYYSGVYQGVDYRTEAEKGNGFGVLEGSSGFFDDVLKSTDKIGLPVGAGPYKASDANGESTQDRNKFNSNNVVYFMRNDYFETLGSGINNAKIKYVTYKVYGDDQIMTALTTGELDFGTPNATPANVSTVSDDSDLGHVEYLTGGYGYVGVNPKYIPEYPVRQAIMKAMDTTMTIGYYGTSLAQTVYRPMSKTSWVYEYADKMDADINNEYPSIAFTTDDSEIQRLVASAGYTLKNGIYTKTSQPSGMANAEIGTTLKFTFWIAGDTTDHPAYSMFVEAAETLNSLGFNITVQKNTRALQKLLTGDLEVWAAAWSTTLDPDMYQIYHKDSNATSVNNWNYPNILKDSTGKWNYEQGIIDELSTLIDEARQTNDEKERALIYGDCLDLVMDLAVELPTYQRSDMCVYNKTVIDANSLVKKPSYTMGLFDRLWEIDYV